MKHRNRRTRHAKAMRHRKAIGKRRKELAGEEEPLEVLTFEPLAKTSIFSRFTGAAKKLFHRRHQSR